MKRFAARCKLRRGGPWRLSCADLKSGAAIVDLQRQELGTRRCEDVKTRCGRMVRLSVKGSKAKVKSSVSFGALNCMIISQAFVNIHDLQHSPPDSIPTSERASSGA